MTLSLKVRVAVISGAVLAAGGLAGALVDVSEAYQRFRPWVEPEELRPIQQLAENAFRANRKLRADFLTQQQRLIDDKREELQLKGIAEPKFLKERQQRLDRQKCEYWNELREPEDRRPCF